MGIAMTEAVTRRTKRAFKTFMVDAIYWCQLTLLDLRQRYSVLLEDMIVFVVRKRVDCGDVLDRGHKSSLYRW